MIKPKFFILVFIFKFSFTLESCQSDRNSTPTKNYNKTIQEKIDFSKRRKLGIFFGVNSYEQFDDLRNPIGDVKAIAKKLEQEFGFENRIYENPTDNTILSAIKECRKENFNHGDQLLIFFSGHGTFDEASNEGFIVPKNGLSNDPNQRSYIGHSALANIISGIDDCSHILIVIDACYSGTFDRTLLRDIDIAYKSQSFNYKRPGDGDYAQRLLKLQNWLQPRSRLYLASGGKERTPDGVNHSPFTIKFLEGLDDAQNRKDGIVTINELFSFLEQATPPARKGQFEGHEPNGNFLFTLPYEIPCCPESSDGTIVDAGGNSYNIKEMADGKLWMTSNLNLTADNGQSNCYEGKVLNCEKYGYLYTYSSAVDACRAFGEGWRLPTIEDWKLLQESYENVKESSYEALMSGGSSGFDARLGGIRKNLTTGDRHENLADVGYYWSSDKVDKSRARAFTFRSDYSKIYTNSYLSFSSGASCRCVKEKR